MGVIVGDLDHGLVEDLDDVFELAWRGGGALRISTSVVPDREGVGGRLRSTALWSGSIGAMLEV